MAILSRDLERSRILSDVRHNKVTTCVSIWLVACDFSITFGVVIVATMVMRDGPIITDRVIVEIAMLSMRESRGLRL